MNITEKTQKIKSLRSRNPSARSRHIPTPEPQKQNISKEQRLLSLYEVTHEELVKQVGFKF
jgi:hypothetical protein